MTTPNVQELEPFLASLTLLRPPNPADYSSEVITPAGLASGVDKHGQPIDKVTPELRVWYTNVGGFTLKSLISIIESSLRRKRHLSNRQVTLAVIGLYLNLRQPSQLSPDFLFQVLENTTPASATLFYVFPRVVYLGTGTRVSPFQFGPYSFGELDMAQLRRLCKLAKSDYYDRYENDLRHRFAILREFPEVALINWYPYREQRVVAFNFIQPLGELFNELIENYFGQMHQVLFDRFFSGIHEEQLLTIAVGDTYLDERALESLPLSDKIAIFQNIDGKHENGFVKPRGTGRYIDFAAVDSRLPSATNRLRNAFNLSDLSDAQIHQTIKKFALFVSKAKIHIGDDNFDDAFLHFMIALDLLFGEEGQSTDSVSRRAAVLTYQKAKTGYKEQVKRIRKLYTERSKYVHEGRLLSKDSVDEAESICNEVLLCMLRLQKNERRRPQIVVDNWLKNIDLVAATLEADKAPDGSLLTECGIE